MNILTDLMNAKTINETHKIRAKYLPLLPDNQKCRLEEMVRRAGIRIRRIDNERKQSFKNLLN